MDEEIKTVNTYLNSRTFHASKEWIEGCVGFFKEEHEGQTYSKSDLLDFVTQQWMLADLREFGIGCLPPNLALQMKVTLHGKYSLQAEMVYDISQPCYKQLQQIRNESTDNIAVTEKPKQSWEPKGTRMLQLHLCDGVQEVQAIEYQPLPLLNNPLTPGFKVLIIGPVDCRRGVLLLKQHNLQLIGGEVDTLIIPNATENVLARSLKLPENPDPYNSQITMGPNTSVATSGLAVPTVQPVQAATSTSGLQSRSDFPDDDEMLDLMMVNAELSELEQQYQRNQTSSAVGQQPPNQTDYGFEDELESMDLDALEQQSLQEFTVSVPKVTQHRPPQKPKTVQYGTTSHNLPTPKPKEHASSRHHPSPPVSKVTRNGIKQYLQPPSTPRLMQQFLEDDDEFLLEMPMEDLEMKEYNVQNKQSVQVSKATSSAYGVSTRSDAKDDNVQRKITNFLNDGKPKVVSEKWSENHHNRVRNIIESSPIINNKKPSLTTFVAPSACLGEGRKQQHDICDLAKSRLKVPSVDTKCLALNENSAERPLAVLTCSPSDSEALSSEQPLPERSGPRLVDPHPFVYLVQVAGTHIRRPAVYTVKAFVLTLTTYLSMKRKGWHLTAKLCDGSAVLEVKFSSEVLEKFIGFNAVEMMAMKHDMAKNPLVKEKVKLALDRAQQQLISLNCLLEIQFQPGEEVPCVIGTADITAEHLTALKSRQAGQTLT